MISDSVPWRIELLAIAKRLRQRSVQRRWTERTYFLVERDVMVAAYAVRRLQDSQKSSTRLPLKRYPVTVHPLRGSVPRPLDRWDVQKFYDLDVETRSEVDLTKLYNQIIHSFVFQLFENDAGTTSVAVASDRTRTSHLYVFQLETLADLFDYVGREDVMRSSWGQDMPDERISNHDLVEDGLATYGDESTTWIIEDKDQSGRGRRGDPDF